ncbi:MAG: hypothetical protein AAGF95_34545 [Chloroflexota bacterium]
MRRRYVPIAASAKSIAELFDMDRSTYYRRIYPHVMSGDIDSICIGRTRRVFIDSLVAWMREQDDLAMYAHRW